SSRSTAHVEENHVAHGRRRSREVGASWARRDILDELRPLLRAVAPPQLAAVNAVVGSEKQRPVRVDELLRVRRLRIGVDVLDELGAGRTAVALPQLAAVDAVVRSQKYSAVDEREVVRIGTGITLPRLGMDVFDESSSSCRAVAFPQLVAMNSVIRTEEE